jgi:5-formyltetrahydrofolate cyclo-ligase
VFRAWRPGDALVAAGFGTQEPAADRPEVRPDIVLAPLLACDERGWRLGYGGGYYDRTLRRLRGDGAVLAVGVGYDEQVVAAVPHEDFDEPLDWIATDARLIRCAG